MRQGSAPHAPLPRPALGLGLLASSLSCVTGAAFPEEVRSTALMEDQMEPSWDGKLWGQMGSEIRHVTQDAPPN